MKPEDRVTALVLSLTFIGFFVVPFVISIYSGNMVIIFLASLSLIVVFGMFVVFLFLKLKQWWIRRRTTL